MNTRPNDDKMISLLFFRLLPVQAALVAMGSINAIVDGVVAGRQGRVPPVQPEGVAR